MKLPSQTTVGTVLQGPCPRMPFYTELGAVFRAFNGRARDFDWLISDIECNGNPLEFQTGGPDWFMTGDELADLVERESPHLQFMWGVLSGLRRGTAVDVARLASLPCADSNDRFWRGAPDVQYPGALVEIVCWDSGTTLVLSKDADLTRRFRQYFPEARDLEAFNASLGQ